MTSIACKIIHIVLALSPEQESSIIITHKKDRLTVRETIGTERLSMPPLQTTTIQHSASNFELKEKGNL